MSEDAVQRRLRDIGDVFHRAAVSTFPGSTASAARLLIESLRAGGKILIFGNGGSASDAQHFAGELVVRFRQNRKALPAVAVCSDAAVMTACANDFGFEHVFARQIEALAVPGDVALGISTSGKSANVLKGLQFARANGLKTILLTGCNPPAEASLFDVVIAAPAPDTATVQQLHQSAYHVLCELIEADLFDIA